jgi:hypothetical protein
MPVIEITARGDIQRSRFMEMGLEKMKICQWTCAQEKRIEPVAWGILTSTFLQFSFISTLLQCIRVPGYPYPYR